jgi:hypothetical protein
VTRLVQLVADYGPGDLAYAEAVQGIAALLPEAEVHGTLVAPGDTLAAGLCVGQLAHATAPPGTVIVHDVDGADAPFWVGRTAGGTLVAGAGWGWTWSFVAGALHELCALDVNAGCDLALAVRHAVGNHPHAVRAVVPHDRVPAPPQCAVVWVDRAGSIQTTLAVAPAHERVMVRIGDRSAEAVVARGGAEGELALVPGVRGLQRLAVAGGSAAERFGGPGAGTPVEVTPQPAPAGRRRASAADR